jgi:hypothetical protein
MQNFVSTFSPSKSLRFVNEHFSRKQQHPHRLDCHSPPHASRVGLHDDRSPPRRLAAVARSDPWKTPPAQVGFRGDATRRRSLPWVVGSDRWNTGRGEDYLRRDMPDEDCHPEEEFYALAALGAPRIELEACAFTHEPKAWEAFRGWVSRLYEQDALREEIPRRNGQYVQRWKRSWLSGVRQVVAPCDWRYGTPRADVFASTSTTRALSMRPSERLGASKKRASFGRRVGPFKFYEVTAEGT